MELMVTLTFLASFGSGKTGLYNNYTGMFSITSRNFLEGGMMTSRLTEQLGGAQRNLNTVMMGKY